MSDSIVISSKLLFVNVPLQQSVQESYSQAERIQRLRGANAENGHLLYHGESVFLRDGKSYRAVMTNHDDLLPVTGAPVPVFDCHVIVTPDDGSGVVKLRCTTLPDVTASGATERDALHAIVKVFKEYVRPFSENSKPIPFARTPEKPGPGESERWIPVHL